MVNKAFDDDSLDGGICWIFRFTKILYGMLQGVLL